MRRSTGWLIGGAIAAVVIAWLLLEVVFHVAFFAARVIVTLLVVAIGFFAVSLWLRARRRRS